VGYLELYIITFLLALNFLSLTLNSNIRMKNNFYGPVITFTLMNTIMLAIGWGLAYLIQPTLGRFETIIYPVLLLFVGAKVLMRAITIKKEKRKYEILHIVDTVELSIVSSIDALIIGLGLGVVSISFWSTMGMIEVNTIVLSALGIIIKNKRNKAADTRSIDFVIGSAFVVMGVLRFIEASGWD